LVVDDCSTVPLELNIDSRITVFRNTKNLGPGLSRNVGLEYAKGNYIAFLDSDDYWHKEFLEITLKEIKNNVDVSFVYTKAIDFFKNKQFSKRGRDSYQNTILPNILINKRGWNSSSCLWDAHLIKNIRFGSTKNWEDYAFDVEVGLINNKIKFIDKYLVYCDAQGEDKLSKSNYYSRSLQKTYSQLKIYQLLKDTHYIKNKYLKSYLIVQFITSLEILEQFENKRKGLEEELFFALEALQSKLAFKLTKFFYKNSFGRMKQKVLNKIKKYFY